MDTILKESIAEELGRYYSANEVEILQNEINNYFRLDMDNDEIKHLVEVIMNTKPNED